MAITTAIILGTALAIVVIIFAIVIEPRILSRYENSFIYTLIILVSVFISAQVLEMSPNIPVSSIVFSCVLFIFMLFLIRRMVLKKRRRSKTPPEI
jgi:hypothetical protein